MKLPKVSIIIPLYVIEDRFFYDLKKFDQLLYSNVEILVVCDKKVALPRLKTPIKLILTHKKSTGPAKKRDIAIQKAKGSFCAFIDDDAYPDKNWLENAVRHFAHPDIVAVGGPGITPKEDTYRGQLTGLVYSSFFCGGHAQYRFVRGKMQFVDDYPAYNLVVRKDILKEVGGYGSHFYGGEDTFLCLKIVKAGYKILYDPNAIVYHHRRALFLPYLKQISNIGMHRGYFAKKFPETSLRIVYFLPTLFVGGIIILFLTSSISHSFYLFFSLFFLIYCIVFLSVIKKTSINNAVIVSTGIILTHFVYGISFVRGLVTKNLKR